MEASEHAKEQLKKRFNISSIQEVEGMIRNSQLMSQEDVNKCGTQYRKGFVYLRCKNMMLVCRGDKIINALWVKNPFLKIKRQLRERYEAANENILQKC